MTAILKTNKSALILHDIDPEICELIKTCVETVDSELDVNPEITISTIYNLLLSRKYAINYQRNRIT